MERHFTVVVEVKETIPPQPIEDSKGYTAKGLRGVTMLSERAVVDRLCLVVSVENQYDAIERAIVALQTQQEFVGPASVHVKAQPPV